MRIYAIGDIHGQLEKLKEAHARIEADRARFRDLRAKVVHLGDYVDRGPDSKGVLDYLIKGVEDGKPWINIIGNHDRLLQRFIETGKDRDGLSWFNSRMGGTETLASYGVKKGMLTRLKTLQAQAEVAVPTKHMEFLRRAPLYHQTRELLFVHAGIRPGLPLEDQTEEDLIWIRDEFLTDTRNHGKIVVHGHTPVDEPEHHGNRIALDTGAAYGGPLTAAVFEGARCWILTENGRERLDPAAVSLPRP